MKKVGLIVLGVLLGLFGFAQVLQLAGVIGTKTFSMAGVVGAVAGLGFSYVCLQKAFEKK